MAPDTANEIWTPVPGWERSCVVSTEGRVMSSDRMIDFADGRLRFFKGQLLKQKINSRGYPVVSLCAGEKKKVWVQVHCLVLTAFIGPRPRGYQGCHNDGDKLNTYLNNLRWDTAKGNHADKKKHGTHLAGEKHPGSKYSNVLISEIRKANGTITEIAERFNVSRTYAWNVRNHKRRITP